MHRASAPDRRKRCADWCELSTQGCAEMWRRARLGGFAPPPAPHVETLQEHMENARRWLLGPTCGLRLQVWHAAQHFMLRCALRVRAELFHFDPKDVEGIDVRLHHDSCWSQSSLMPN